MRTTVLTLLGLTVLLSAALGAGTVSATNPSQHPYSADSAASASSATTTVTVTSGSGTDIEYTATSYEIPSWGDDPVEQNTSHHTSSANNGGTGSNPTHTLTALDALIAEGYHKVESGQLAAWEIVIEFKYPTGWGPGGVVTQYDVGTFEISIGRLPDPAGGGGFVMVHGVTALD